LEGLVKTKSLILFGAAAGITGLVLAVRRYHRQLFEAFRQISSASHLIETSKGTLEYAETGSGPAVLISAGMGGYDLGLQFAWPEHGFRYISVSRPGYLHTPLYTGRSFEEQADMFAALLDHLGIEKVAVMGISSGGPAAIQFALRYPERCWGLVLISSPNQPLAANSFIRRIFNNPILSSDFLAWLALRPIISKFYLDSNARRLIGSSEEKMHMFSGVTNALFPLSFRRNGIINDFNAIQEMPLYPIDLIQTPTLVIHGDQDDIVPYQQGKWSAGRIRQAFFLVIQGGRHLSFISHLEMTRQALLTFLAARAPKEEKTDIAPGELN
jgi:pimeloyl-ACP methyl ester carboxylesterase